MCIQFNNLTTVRGGSGFRDKIKNSTWNGEMQRTAKEKVSTQRQKHCTFTDNEYKEQLLGKYTKLFFIQKD